MLAAYLANRKLIIIVSFAAIPAWFLFSAFYFGLGAYTNVTTYWVVLSVLILIFFGVALDGINHYLENFFREKEKEGKNLELIEDTPRMIPE